MKVDNLLKAVRLTFKRPGIIVLGVFAGAVGGAAPVAFVGQTGLSGGAAESAAVPEISGQSSVSALADILSGLPFIFSGLVIAALLLFVLWSISVFSRIAVVIAVDASSEVAPQRKTFDYLDDGARFFFRVAVIDLLVGILAAGITVALLFSELTQIVGLIDRLPGSGIELLRLFGVIADRFLLFLGGLIIVGGVPLLKPAAILVVGLIAGAGLWGIRETAIRWVVLQDLSVWSAIRLAALGAIKMLNSRALAIGGIFLFSASLLFVVSVLVSLITIAVFLPDLVVRVAVGVVVIISIGVMEVVVGSFWNQHYRSERSFLYSGTRDKRNESSIGE